MIVMTSKPDKTKLGKSRICWRRCCS